MANIHEKGLKIGLVALAALTVLAGCGALPSALKPPARHHRRQQDPKSGSGPSSDSGSTYRPKSTSVPVEGTDFPKIMAMAMGSVKGLVASSAEAPTVIPWPATHSTVLYYMPSVQGLGSGIPGLIDRYQINLSSPPDAVAAFSSAVFSDPSTASENVESLLSADGLSVPLTGASMPLAHGVAATIGIKGKINILAWHQEGWSVVVAARGRLPVASAKKVVYYLETHLMPVPQPNNEGQALVVVDVRENGPYTSVAWQEGRWVYSTAAYPTAANPITTALELAWSMRDYSTLQRGS